MIIAIDTGGTFTDIVLAVDGRAYVLKLPSTPEDPALAAIEGIRRLAHSPTRPLADSVLIHGSTVATNALSELKGARVFLITNRGFEDVIEIGRQNRPQLYALSSTRPAPLVRREDRVGISGRLDHLGNELQPVDEQELSLLGERAADAAAIAICMLHSYANPAHEIKVA